ncbi:DUF928 domain-containing protein, partial [Chamaesiphon polymorphus]
RSPPTSPIEPNATLRKIRSIPLQPRMSRHFHLHLLRLTTLLLLTTPQISTIAAPLKYVPDPTFSVLSRKGTPKDITYGGGKRSICLTRANPERGLRAIVPTEDVGGLSATTKPTFWIYQPYISQTPLAGVLSVRVADSYRSQPFIKVPVTLPAQTGLVRLQLPRSIDRPGMLAWTLTIVCDEISLSRNPFVSGLVMVKPNPELLQRVAGLSQSERAVEFARAGYWYDALDLVATTEGEIGVQRLMESDRELRIEN